MKQGYDQKLVDKQLEKFDKVARDDLLQEKDKKTKDPKRIPLILTYNRFLLNLRTVLRTSKNLRELCQEHPITAFKRNKNLKEIVGGTCIKNSKVKKFNIPSRTGKCTPCLSGAGTLCFNQVLTTNTIINQQTKRTFNIFFNLNCKSEYVIYVMECILCKMQYVGKVETVYNLRLNNHRKDTKKPNSILACEDFEEQGHDFNNYAKFIIIDKLVNLERSNEALGEMLVVRENFWIQKLKTLVPIWT